MTTEPINHHEAAESMLGWADRALNRQSPDPVAVALISISHWLGALLAELRDEDAYDVEDPHAVDAEDPDVDDTVEQPRVVVGHIPGADIQAGLGATWDNQPGGAA